MTLIESDYNVTSVAHLTKLIKENIIDETFLRQNITTQGVDQLDLYCRHLENIDSIIGQSYIDILDHINDELDKNIVNITGQTLFSVKCDMLITLYMNVIRKK